MKNQYVFSLLGTLTQPITQVAVATVIVNVVDENDHSPEFDQPVYRVNVSEAKLVGTVVVHAKATDLDTFPLTYSLSTGQLGKFQVDNNGVITLASPLDYDIQNFYRFSTIVNDGIRTASAIVEVTVLPVNKPPPTFNQTIYIQTIPENFPVGNTVLQVDSYNIIPPRSYLINEASGREFFSLDAQGNIRLVKTVNYEQQRQHVFTMTVNDKRRSGYATVVVNIENVNDECPVFAASPIIRYNGNPVNNHIIYTVKAVDADNMDFNFTIVSGNSDGYFAIDRQSGEITAVKEFPLSFSQTFVLTINALDGRCQPTPSIPVTIEVTTCADPHDYQFTQPKYVFNLMENRQLGIFGAVNVRSGRAVRYSMPTHSHFSFSNTQQGKTIMITNF